MLNIEIAGIEKLNEKLRKVSDSRYFEPFMRKVAQRVFDEAEKGAAIHSKTGILERSLGSGAEKVGEQSYRIRSNGQICVYNQFVHWGTRPHRIYPKDRKALRWVGGSKFHFAKFVDHPGYKGDPFMNTAVTNVMKDFDSLVKQHLRDL